jgi:hypothetical protein
MRGFFLVAATVALAGAAAGACGGVTGASLFAAGGGGTSTTSSSSTGGQSSSTSSGQTSSSSSTTTSSSSTTTSSSSTSSSTSSSGTTTSVYCAGAPCPAGDICCFDPTSSNPPDHCGAPGQCGSGYSQVSCSSPAACPSGYCCAQFILAGNPPQQFREYTQVACQATCGFNSNETTLCDPTSGTPCPFGGNCVQSQLLGTGYFVCD